MKSSNVLLTIRVLLTLTGWFFLLAIVHSLIHTFSAFFPFSLDEPIPLFISWTLGLSLLIYLFVWSLPNVNKPSWKTALTIFIWAVMVAFGHGVTHLGESKVELLFIQIQEIMGLAGFLVLAGAYALFLAIPFVAGVEIGFLIMAIFGVKGVLVAYIGTILGLNIAFAIGRLLPKSILGKCFNKFDLKIEMDNLPALLDQLTREKHWLSVVGGTLLRNRYISIGLCLNFPGNSIVGGGGGLSMLAGMSHRLVRWPYFLIVSLLAPLPVPVLVLVGLLNIDGVIMHSGWFHELMNTIIPAR
ncbi:hypothetical protein [Vibrio sp. CAU 1672]|uniref:hypothetical protein n=1 Tax=Vibrio sp. CAU 1672 TaxID=3032594 RepID=UPI0023DCAC0E|nr:hypothetical protein [Vibrio sp. CAU 1672]MDF2152946.1 hypothetical protein [Vibrio sp. CAU 1672]